MSGLEVVVADSPTAAVLVGGALIVVGMLLQYWIRLECDDRADVRAQRVGEHQDDALAVAAAGQGAARVPVQRTTNGEDTKILPRLVIPEGMCKVCGRGELITEDGWVECNYCPAKGWPV